MIRVYIIGSFLLLYAVKPYAQERVNKDSLLYDSGQNHTYQIMKSSVESDSVRFKKESGYTIFTPIKTNDFSSTDRDMPIDIKQQETQSALEQVSFPTITLQEKRERSKPFLAPYSYSFDSFLEGITIKGFYGNYVLTDFLEVNLNIFASKTFFGNTVSPSFYLNGSLRAGFVFKLHDRVQLTGERQLSMREGLDPKIPSLMGGANYYGAGVQFKITNKVGIGVGFTNNYYRGEWTKRTYMAPVGY